MSDPAPGEDTFTAADLEPSDDEVRAGRALLADRIAAAVAALALGVWSGGMVALGACAAPQVFDKTPYPFSANAMGATFAQFDTIAVGCAAVALGAEVVRTVASLRSGSRSWWPRVRRYATIVAGAAAVFVAVALTPEINRLHGEGVRRNEGPQGAQLESIHAQAELLGKLQVVLAFGLVLVHVLTVRTGTEEELEAEAPLPPGPFGRSR